MPTSFEYIDSVMDKAVEAQMANPRLSDKEKQEAATKSRKLIAGFRVQDEEAEKNHLDAMVAQRRKALTKFIDDRKIVREKLQARGITPLAVCPTEAWDQICIKAGLFILSPDTNNKVSFNHSALIARYNVKTFAKEIERNWGGFLRTIFPNQLAKASQGYYNLTVQLPDPPADVAKTLVKAHGLKMRTAAVAEAISFVENPGQIWAAASANEKDLWARAQGYADYADWVKRDPIVFHDHGTATAIIAQFGEFPIEKEVVDAVVGLDDLVSDKLEVEVALQAAAMGYGQFVVQQSNFPTGLFGGVGTLGGAYTSGYVQTGTANAVTMPNSVVWAQPREINSTTWTGR